MIYEPVDANAPIRQGDIFKAVPRVESPLDRLAILKEDGTTVVSSWQAIASTEPEALISAILLMRSVTAIVITQDCDAVRAPMISLCEIRPFMDVMKLSEPKSPKAWVELLTKQARINQKWFYLPPDDRLGLASKMAVDFQTVLRLRREDIDEMRRDHRVGRLNEVAEAHFRERLGDFFRRYPYDEWYSFDREEFAAYRESKPEPIAPYPGQV